MGRLYLVPDMDDMEQMCKLADKYDCAFEYNNFYMGQVLDAPERQTEIITYYRKYRKDFTQDTIHGAFLDVTIHSSDSLIRDASMLRINQSMEIAGRMGVKGVVFHTGRLAGFREQGYLDNWKKVNAAFFTELADKYPGQQIYMENMFDEAPDILAELAEQMKEVKNFGICLDYAHAIISGRPGKEWVETLAPYIKHMHINDNDKRNDLHQPVGSGSIDWQEFDSLIRKYGINSSVLVEVKGFEAQKKSLEFMNKYGIYPMDKKEIKSEPTI